MLGVICFIGGCIAGITWIRWKRWKEVTDLGSGKFLKYYMYSNMNTKPKRAVKRLRGK